MQNEKTLRDEFAMSALSGDLIERSPADYRLKAWFGERTGIRQEEHYAAQAYAIADAMMKRRSA